MNTPTTHTPAYFGDSHDPLRPTVCHHCAGHGYEPVADPFTHAQALEPCPECDGTGEEPTLCSCTVCGWSGSLWDLVLTFEAGQFLASCPACSRQAPDPAGGPRGERIDLDAPWLTDAA